MVDFSRFRKKLTSSTSILIIALNVLVLYLATNKFCYDFYLKNIPSGDGYTYATTFYQTVLLAKGHYLWSLERIFSNPMVFWTQHILSSLLAPIMHIHAASLAMINFLALFLSMVSLFRLGKSLGGEHFFSLIVSFFPLFFPFQFGLGGGGGDISLFSTTPEPVFLNLVTAAAANVIVFALNTSDRKSVYFASSSVILAVWSRGSSIPVVFFATVVPLLYIALNYSQGKYSSSQRRNIQGFLVSTAVGSIVFFAVNLRAIAGYYGPAAAKGIWGTTGIINSLTDYRIAFGQIFFGDSFARFGNHPWLGFTVTIVGHVLALGAVIEVLRRPKSYFDFGYRLVVLSGATLFYGLYFLLTVILQIKILDYNLTVMAPITIGFLLVMLAIVIRFSKLKIFSIVNHYGFIAALLLIPICSAYATAWFNIKEVPRFDGALSPADVTAFTHEVSEWSDGGKQIAFLWYGLINWPLINHELVKNDKKLLSFYSNDYWSSLWIPNIRPERPSIEKALRLTFLEADVVIMAKCKKNYGNRQDRYPLYWEADILFDFLNSPEAPRMRLVRVLKEREADVLVLEKASKDDQAYLWKTTTGCE